MKRFLELWKTLIIVKNTTANGIDMCSISGAIMGLHIKNIIRKEQYGRDSFMAG